MNILTMLYEIEPITRGIRVPLAALTLAFCIYNLYAIIRAGRTAEEDEKFNYWPWLSAIFLLAVVIRVLLYPHHAGLMNDDYYNMKNAMEIIDPNFTPINGLQKPIGWPFILSILFWLFGASEYVLFYANSVIGCLSVIAIFFLVRRMSGSIVAGIAAAIFLAVNPLHTMWSICGENNVTSLFFMIVCLAALFGFLRFHHHDYISLALFSASFASQTRGENLVLFLLMPAGMFILGRKAVFDIRKVIQFTIIPVLLTIPSLLSYETVLKFFTTDWSASDSGGAVYGQNISFNNIVTNLANEIDRITGISDFAFVIVVFAALGVLLAWKKHYKLIIFLAIIGASYTLLMSSLWQTLAARERFFMNAEVCLISIGALGVSHLVERYAKYRTHIMAIFIIVPTFLSFGFHVKNLDPENEYFYLGMKMTESMDRMRRELPAESVLIVQDPTPYQVTTDFTCITPYLALDNIQHLQGMKNVYYILDISSDKTPQEFFDVFRLEKVFLFNAIPESIGQSNYGLYSVYTNEKGSPAPGGSL